MKVADHCRAGVIPARSARAGPDMTASRRDDVVATLRRQILSRVHLGLFAAGSRLASVREAGRELGVNPRMVLAAYRQLESEGLVELRERSGAFVAQGHDAPAGPAAEWLVGLLAPLVQRGIPAPELADHVRRALETRRLRAAVIECNEDQRFSIAEELSRDYGLEVRQLDLDALHDDPRAAAGLRQFDLLVTTGFHAKEIHRLAQRFGVRPLVVTMCVDLYAEVERLLRFGTVYFVITDPRFAGKLAETFHASEFHRNLRVLVYGRDDVSVIPADAPTYITRLTRSGLNKRPIANRILPESRMFSPECIREILAFVVHSNLAAAEARTAAHVRVS